MSTLEDAAQGLQMMQFQSLERVMAMACYSASGDLSYANSIYLNLLGLTLEQAQGRSHQSFCRPAFVASAEYAQMWAGLREGQPFSGVVERVHSDGSCCWLEATYSPVFDAQGHVVQVMSVATDITARHSLEISQRQRLRMLSLVADASDTAVLISDASSRIAYINGGFSRMFGWEIQEIVGRDPSRLLAPHVAEGFGEEFRCLLKAGQSVNREEIVVGKQGQRYWAKVQSNPMLDAAGHWQYTVSVLTDITSSKMHEVLQHRVMEAMAKDHPLVEVLEMMCKEVERIAPEVTASILEVDEQGLLHPLASPSLPAAYSSQLEGLAVGDKAGSCGTAAWRNESVVVHDIATDPLWSDYKHLILPLGYQACWSTPIRGKQGQAVGTFAFYYRDARAGVASAYHQQLVDACTHMCALALEREHSRQRIRQLAFYDTLTGLPNRSLLLAKAEQVLASTQRGAVLFIDLDRFKQVNDSLGHPAGDQLLRATAARLRQVLRNSDIVGRLSGDEFVAVLPDCDAAYVAIIIERLQELMAQSVSFQDSAVAVTASIGIAMFPEDGREMETLMHRADMAMYQAKKTGRGGFSFFSRELNRLAQERMALEHALRQALKEGALHLHYQPQIELHTGRLYGVEALARWTHGVLGEISPARFIPLAEECGLIGELGRWAVGEACRQLGHWRALGLAVPSVAVNLSPSNFHNLDLPRMVADALERNALQPKDLTIELTESILLDTNPSTMQTIHEVHAQGVRLSMDDFGTGYSSLSYLRRLPVSELKLDRSFVADIEHDEAAQALSGAILGIGKSLHLTVVAEGIETPVQHVMLRDQGYHVAQGYLFARPLTPKAFEQWLHEQTVVATP
ncbi:EAL domain-containing protein [Comamonas sp. Y33R10-2]|uniref:bifunctional diguanylate cyclase/phosphodiesterase n=1 Tax=Comamonas sp. Y33R10-2 TaxID=2853257 RepID=UPI001C5CB0F2|nr:EAL domain-containing protein [Comamonas sp. Y33R10-2]QXZ10905.1 EAL domain-containing protein [Comamonas sp. Y33R10-2]